MGGIITTIRDLKVVLRDLKITLKYTAKIVLKVHGIVDDMEQTMQDLKQTVNGLSSRLPKSPCHKSIDEASMAYVTDVVHTIESKAESVKASLSNAVAVLTSDDLIKNTSTAWENLVNQRNLNDVVGKWASVPEGLGDLVKQDYEKVTNYLHCAEENVPEEKMDAEKTSTEKPQSSTKENLYIENMPKRSEIILGDDMENTTKIVCTIPLTVKEECALPELMVEKIIADKIEEISVIDILLPLQSSSLSDCTNRLSAIIKANQEENKNHDKKTSMLKQCENNDIEFKRRCVSLFLVNLLQGLVENEAIGELKGNSILVNATSIPFKEIWADKLVQCLLH